MRKQKIGIAVVGLGRFGQKRLKSVVANERSVLRVVADALPERAKDTAQEFGCESTENWQQAVERDDVDAVIVSTSTRHLSEIALAALAAGKHVLCEKPFGRNADEVLPAVEAAERQGLCLKVGYNHRYHPAIEKAHEMFRQGAIGRLQFMRCVYGHGGREGYGQEWRTKAEIAGGGQLLDQGVHALDLFRWFAGEFSTVKACTSTAFWPIAPLEDNIFVLLKNSADCIASLHASWTQWRNSFLFEVFGDEGYLVISGLGGFYGLERLCYGKRQALGTTPQEQYFEFPDPDQSLHREWTDFLDCIEQGRQPYSDGRDAWRTLQLAEAIYQSARESGNQVAENKTSLIPEPQLAGEHTR